MDAAGDVDGDIDSDAEADGDCDEEGDPLGDSEPLGDPDPDSVPLLLGVVPWANAAPEIPAPGRSDVDARQTTTKARTSLAVRL